MLQSTFESLGKSSVAYFCSALVFCLFVRICFIGFWRTGLWFFFSFSPSCCCCYFCFRNAKTQIANYAACVIATRLTETWLIATCFARTSIKWSGSTVGYIGSSIDTDNLLSCGRHHSIGHFECAAHFGCIDARTIRLVCIINRWSHSILSSFEGEFWKLIILISSSLSPTIWFCYSHTNKKWRHWINMPFSNICIFVQCAPSTYTGCFTMCFESREGSKLSTFFAHFQDPRIFLK